MLTVVLRLEAEPCDHGNEAMASTHPSPKTFNFTALPGELRNKIYDYIAINDGHVSIDWPSYRRQHPPHSNTAQKTHLSLLRLNHAIRREARPRFFLENTFEFSTPCALVAYLQAIGPSGRNRLTRVVLHHQYFASQPCGVLDIGALAKSLVLLSWCPRLRYLGIYVKNYVPVEETWMLGPGGNIWAPPVWVLRYSPKRVRDLPAFEEFREFKRSKDLKVEFIFESIVDGAQDALQEWHNKALAGLGWTELGTSARR